MHEGNSIHYSKYPSNHFHKWNATHYVSRQVTKIDEIIHRIHLYSKNTLKEYSKNTLDY